MEANYQHTELREEIPESLYKEMLALKSEEDAEEISDRYLGDRGKRREVYEVGKRLKGAALQLLLDEEVDVSELEQCLGKEGKELLERCYEQLQREIQKEKDAPITLGRLSQYLDLDEIPEILNVIPLQRRYGIITRLSYLAEEYRGHLDKISLGIDPDYVIQLLQSDARRTLKNPDVLNKRVVVARKIGKVYYQLEYIRRKDKTYGPYWNAYWKEDGKLKHLHLGKILDREKIKALHRR